MSQDAPRSPAQLSSLRETFPGYFPPNDDQMRAFLTAGMVVLDTNTLLDAYKLTGTARAEFLDALRLLGDRLFIPHQVGLEFMRQRATVIKTGTAFPARFREAAKKLHGEVQSLKEHRRLQNEDISSIKAAIDDAIEDLLQRHADLYDFGVSLETNIERDPLFKEIEQITADKVGPPFAKPGEMAKLGNQRLKDKVPPGYADHDKDPDKALGDYFLWEQTIIEAVARRLPVLIVSNDGKEDWVRKEDGYVRGPRPELVDEMLNRAGQPFHRVNVKSFLTLAKTHLSAQVSDSTIEEAESVQKQADQASSASAAVSIDISALLEPMSVDDRVMLKQLLEHLVRDRQSNRRTYQNRDDDPRGPWRAQDLTTSARGALEDDFKYSVTSPTGHVFSLPALRGWSVREEEFRALDENGRIFWGENGDLRPVRKRFLSEAEYSYW